MKICKPVVNKSLGHMNGLQRTAECWRYFILRLEHWISPGGELREWMKMNARIAAYMTAPVCIVFPVIVGGLYELSSCVGNLTTIAAKLVATPILIFLAVVICIRLLRH